jgi:hypothetical protein
MPIQRKEETTGGNMRGVGYISGNTLDQIQHQWGQLSDAEVNVILFDRHFVNRYLDQHVPREHAAEAESMWRYMETMRAGQDISGNVDNYQVLEDLQTGDTLVLTELDTLKDAEPAIWNRIYTLCTNGVHLAVLSNGFHSAGQFGDTMLAMMNATFSLGALTTDADQKGTSHSEAHPQPRGNPHVEDLVAAVYAFLGDPGRQRFEVTLCDDIPDGWYRTFDPTGWFAFSIIDTTEQSIGATPHVLVNPTTLEVRNLGRLGE